MEDLKEMERVNKLADDILEVVMNVEDVPPEAVISALSHVAALIARELKMPEQAFAYCVVHAFRTVAQAEEDKEVH